MVLSTHAIAGAATALVFRDNPIIALAAAFSSHYVLDAIPHWHYKLLSKRTDDSYPFGKKIDFGMDFRKDIFRTGFDFWLGLIISLTISQIFFPEYFLLTAFGAFAGALPDALQVFYYRFKNFKPAYWFQWFHEKVHAKRHLNNEPIKGI